MGNCLHQGSVFTKVKHGGNPTSSPCVWQGRAQRTGHGNKFSTQGQLFRSQSVFLPCRASWGRFACRPTANLISGIRAVSDPITSLGRLDAGIRQGTAELREEAASWGGGGLQRCGDSCQGGMGSRELPGEPWALQGREGLEQGNQQVVSSPWEVGMYDTGVLQALSHPHTRTGVRTASDTNL